MIGRQPNSRLSVIGYLRPELRAFLCIAVTLVPLIPLVRAKKSRPEISQALSYSGKKGEETTKRLKVFAAVLTFTINIIRLGLFSGFAGLPQICTRPKLL